jgi:ATP-dependent Lhr-like helicase
MRSLSPDDAGERLMERYGLDEWAANNVVLYLQDQAEAAGVVPDDRTVVVERFRDEIGDWRICILSPFGTPVHAPWAMTIEQRLSEQFATRVETL